MAAALDGDRDTLVLGGDCTVEVCTVAGALHALGSVGLVYINLDVDMTTPATGDGALDWMGLAHLLDADGALPEIASLGPRRPALPGSAVLLFACDNVTGPEARIIDEYGIDTIPLPEVRADPLAAADRAVRWRSRFDRLLVHVESTSSTGSTSRSPRTPAARKACAELQQALAPLVAAPNWRALTLCEVNPDHAPVVAESFAALIDLLAAVLPQGMT